MTNPRVRLLLLIHQPTPPAKHQVPASLISRFTNWLHLSMLQSLHRLPTHRLACTTFVTYQNQTQAACAAALADTLDSVVKEPQSTKAWTTLLHFGSSFLCGSERGGKQRNISFILLKRLNTGPTSVNDHSDRPTINRKGRCRLGEGGINIQQTQEREYHSAVRILCSDDSPADFSSSNLDRLRDKHPSEHAGAYPSSNPAEKLALQVSEIAIIKAVRSFPAGSTGGPDDIRSQHLLELVSLKKWGIIYSHLSQRSSTHYSTGDVTKNSPGSCLADAFLRWRRRQEVLDQLWWAMCGGDLQQSAPACMP